MTYDDKRLVTIGSKGKTDYDTRIWNIKTYFDKKDKSYLLTFGMDDNGVYFSLEYHEYKNDDTFYNVKDVIGDPLALGKNLRIIFNRALSDYMGDVRDDKIGKVLDI